TASDGHNSIEEMAEAAQALGLEYLGIADHSRSSIQAHGIDEAKLSSQIAEIRKFNEKLHGFRVFAGVECDVLRDGSLDLPDEVLSQLDYVIASVHSVFNLNKAEMTARVIRAIENPFVTMLAHPTGRLLLKREPYQIDIPAILHAAARTGTWIELNAAPKRLDLDWRWWPLAKQKGVKCVINPDAHRTERLQDLWFGIGIARKGWLTKDDVALNNDSITREVRGFLRGDVDQIGHMLPDSALTVLVEGPGKPKRVAVGQRAKAGIQVVKARINQFHRDNQASKHVCHGAMR